MKKLEQLIERLYERRHQRELDTVLPVVGDEGLGKSTLILQLATKYCAVRDGEPPTIDHLLDRICFDRRDFQEMMADSQKQDVIIVPDAARILYSMDASTSEQKAIEKDLMDVRGLEYMILLGFQSWDRIGGEIKDRRSKLTLKIPRRGLVRGYGREAMDHRIDEGEWPSSTLTDGFAPLDGTELWSAYQQLDEEKKRERLAGDEKQPKNVMKDERRKVAIRATQRLGMSQREAAKLIDYSTGFVSDTVLDWRDGEYDDLVDIAPEATA